ncbi:Binding-protein-dependent transport systems inner membrane component [Candidatus Terasakiella magnetica]|uniref:Binding-protein-dependent transport systems inner membrane component n=1 Tax=Candidatus Terasakiella magnetica TaxID=1867952 RepID=A0A1C3RFD6_9PROT|nr:ABC transporter permease [Candidatus Terasakiella magnetica]SCA55997.1 Binding-protein-dependent transport systems inner membrane component [Candidatus Terasakiella magnetica]
MSATASSAAQAAPLLKFLSFIGGKNVTSVADFTKHIWKIAGIPLIAFAIFLGLWQQSSQNIVTSLGSIPGPVQVLEEASLLWDDHQRTRAKEVAFYERQEKRNAAKLAKDPNAKVKVRQYTGKPTYLDQIVTSLKTVFMGFIIASAIAIPLGIACGLSESVNAAFNPIIQIFKPVSPLAWLPIVTMVVSALYVTKDPMFDKSFLTSAITVTLCSLWPTLINTSLGVASIDKDLMNVSKVLQLKWQTKIFKMILPSSLPLIFTGLRLSLGVGWMVLIAAEMLAQNPGLGKFVWDEFQNGSSHSLGRIMVAVFTIGIIGFALDRIMKTFQNLLTFDEQR